MRFRPLEDMPLLWRLVLAAMIVALAILLLLIATWIFGGNETAAQPTPPPYAVTPYEEDMLALERKGIDEAFQNQVVSVFGVWMKDSTGQPGRAIVGMLGARAAYAGARAKLDEREAKYKQSTGK
jgi:hypothetical protein